MRKRRNKRLRKKGLSAVVTALVIILLVLVSTGTIWVAIKNLIVGGVEEISLGKFSTDLSIKSVKVEGETLSVGVERAVGKGDLVKLKFIFENGTDSEIIERETDIEELDEKSFLFSLGDLSLLNIKKVSIVPVYKSSSGKEVSGDIIDIFELKKPIRGEAGTWEYIGNFEKLGFKGAGRKEYSISSQSENIVKISKAIVDPLDVLPGFNQTFTIHVYSPYGIIDVTTTTELDNSILNLDLQEIGEENGNQIFSATWIVNDVHTTTYRTTIVATDAEGNSDSVTLTWTDSCHTQISFLDHGGDKTIDASCTTGVNDVLGLDGGSITLGTDVDITIANGAQLIFNNGKSLTITASGASIISTGTGSFGNGDLYYTDADGDNYISGSGDNLALSGDIRASDASLLGTNDCNDAAGNGDKWIPRDCYVDSDNDGWTTGGLVSDVCKGSACNSPTGHQATKSTTDDCSPAVSTAYRWLYTDLDGDGHCNGSGQLCKGSESGYTTSCTDYVDCNDAVGNGDKWRTRYDDTDGDAYCSSSTLYCVGNHAGYRDSCTSYSDCNDNSGSVQVYKYYDGDWDGYCPNTGTTCVAAGAGNPYRTSCTDYADCNDGNSYISWTATGTNVDSDRDGHEVGNYGSAVSRCIGHIDTRITVSGRYYYQSVDGTWDYQVWSDKLGVNDCYDANANAYIGQTTYFTTNRGDGSYDYNCVSGGEKQYTATYGACETCSTNAFYPNDETPEWESLQGEGGSSFEWIPLQPEGPEGECFDLGTGQVGWIGTAPACGSADVYYSVPGDCFVDDCPSEAYNCYWSARTQACR